MRILGSSAQVQLTVTRYQQKMGREERNVFLRKGPCESIC